MTPKRIRSIRRRCPVAVLLVLGMAGAADGGDGAPAVRPPADRIERTSADGIRVEYAPDLQPYADAIFAAVPAWLTANQAVMNRAIAADDAAIRPFTFRDFQANRSEILEMIAAEIGLPEPTPQQQRGYDVMLGHYGERTRYARFLADAARSAALATHFVIWRRRDLERRLERGESLPGFAWDKATRHFQFTWGANWAVPGEREGGTPPGHTFTYEIEDGGPGVVGAGFRLGDAPPKHSSPLTANPPATAPMPEVQPVTVPIIVDESNDSLPPARVVERTLEDYRQWARPLAIRWHELRDPALTRVFLHEVTEIGIVEHYLRYKYRRWLCEGAANAVAYDVARRRAEPAFAAEVCDLSEQMTAAAAFRREVDLRWWPAANSEKPDVSPLTGAHYAYATRAVVAMVEAQGPDFLARLFQEIGKTPPDRANARTVEAAYRKLTGESLDRLIDRAMRSPPPLSSVSAANVPDPGQFAALLKRDAAAYLARVLGRGAAVEFALLRDEPTQAGTAYPKFYAWIRAYADGALVSEGAMRLEAIEKRRFEVTLYLTKAEIAQDPVSLEQFFPGELLAQISRRARMK